MNFERGQKVRCMFDTGSGKGMGYVWCYGLVVAAGEKRFTVKWESGLFNRPKQDTHLVEHCDDAHWFPTGGTITP